MFNNSGESYYYLHIVFKIRLKTVGENLFALFYPVT